MSGFSIRVTKSGLFVAESRFMRLGIRKTREAAEILIDEEKERLAFFRSFSDKYPKTYEGQMAASADAERAWEAR